MVLLHLTPSLDARLNALQSQLPAELAALVAAVLTPPATSGLGGGAEGADGKQEQAGQRTVSHELLVKVSKWARGEQGVSCTLSSLLRLTDIHAPPLPPRERSPELLAILASIDLQHQRTSYASMTSITGPQFTSSLPLNDAYDPTLHGGTVKTMAEEWKEVRRQVGAIINVGASMATVATGVWWVGGGRSVQARLGLAMTGAFLIGAIEAFLYYRFFTREEAEEKRGGAAERRKAKVLKFEGVPSAAGSLSEDKKQQ
ncbi:endoplasmic reticulum-based factor for assembly of V-ATPase-domain-containing protein [Leucosporidium creatinivorum]|uniref:Endoplasmic reticulum-based factor for assembly of V-ATPase-domain-containing protein n=1 Tax=Leucosporidium creatinivorum TaxID=106004 RepID=A0A1Y2EC39_9BASI|nr:endoplasmic reticulum-based factor for assembly of V-ATPase-domain-containing protein [Leucosporidium creatinivorum]